GVGSLDLAAALDVDLVDAVAHDLGDVRVVEQGLKGAVAEEVCSNLADELCPLGRRQRHLGGPQGLVEMAGYERGELVGLHSLGQLGAEDLEEDVADPPLHLPPTGYLFGCRA